MNRSFKPVACDARSVAPPQHSKGSAPVDSRFCRSGLAKLEPEERRARPQATGLETMKIYSPPPIDSRIRLGELTPCLRILPADRLAKWIYKSAWRGDLRWFRGWSRQAQGELK